VLYVGAGPEGALGCFVETSPDYEGKAIQREIEHGPVVSLLWVENKPPYRLAGATGAN
jgi:hypothetical protein